MRGLEGAEPLSACLLLVQLTLVMLPTSQFENYKAAA